MDRSHDCKELVISDFFGAPNLPPRKRMAENFQASFVVNSNATCTTWEVSFLQASSKAAERTPALAYLAPDEFSWGQSAGKYGLGWLRTFDLPRMKSVRTWGLVLMQSGNWICSDLGLGPRPTGQALINYPGIDSTCSTFPRRCMEHQGSRAPRPTFSAGGLAASCAVASASFTVSKAGVDRRRGAFQLLTLAFAGEVVFGFGVASST